MMGMCGVGRFMKIWGQRTTDACPQCGDPEVWICKHEGAQKLWNDALEDLRSWMESVNTDPDLSVCVISGLNSGREGMNNHVTSSHLAALQQNDLGWNVAIEGWWSFEWAYMQDSFYQSMDSNKTGRRWMISLIEWVWQIAWELWTHRNEILHQQENDIRDEEEDALNRKVRQLYFKAYSVLKNTTDGYLLKAHPSDWEKKSAIYHREWVKKTELALACATKWGRR